MFKIIGKCLSFFRSKTGTPSIETVAIIAFIALAIFGNLGNMATAVGNVFDSVGTTLESQISEDGGDGDGGDGDGDN